jgi:hypothetical protein
VVKVGGEKGVLSDCTEYSADARGVAVHVRLSVQYLRPAQVVHLLSSLSLSFALSLSVCVLSVVCICTDAIGFSLSGVVLCECANAALASRAQLIA